ncbi:MAG: STAS domain-containing protein [Planctomycetota bacterium]
MKIESQRIGSVAVLTPYGAIAQDEVEEFCQTVEEHREKSNGRFVLEFSEVSYLDSRGLEALWDLADRQRENGQTVKLAGIGELCREIFELTGMSGQLDMFDTAENAVRSFL